MEEKISRAELDEAKGVCRTLFTNDKGQPFELVDGQAELFLEIWKKKHFRVHVQTTTRYGKSEVISMAVLTRACTVPEHWAIVASGEKNAGIIMKYLIGHIFDNEFTKVKFQMEGESAESIKRHKSRNIVNFVLDDGTMSEVKIVSAEKAMGFGAPNIIEDESALISDHYHSFVMRMLGDQTENFLCKVGNPFESNHFRNSAEDPEYHKIIIDYQQGIDEGRLTPQYVEEMRKQPNFRVLYEVKFPPKDQADDQGWVPLMIKDDIDRAMVDTGTVKGFGINRLGVDVAGGGRNFSTMVNRSTNVAKLSYKANESDTMRLAEQVIANKERNNIDNIDIGIDKVGIGRGAHDILRRLTPGLIGINAGEKPLTSVDQEVYFNLRAQMYWKLREWILGGGRLERNPDWYQLTKMWYRTRIEGTGRGKIQMMSKEDMLKRGVESPDVADALSFTFMRPDIIMVKKSEDLFFRNKMLEKRKKQGKGAYNMKMSNY